MAKQNKGLRIGNYRITPLGIATLLILILAIAAVIVFAVVKPFDDATTEKSKATPTPTVPVVSDTPDTTQYVPVVTDTPTIAPTPTPAPKSATIRSLGEIAIQDKLLEAATTENGSYDFSEMFSLIENSIGSADYTIANVEGSMGDTAVYSGSGTQMITPSTLIDALAACGVDMVNLANDHTLDGLFTDLNATMHNLTAAGLEYVGAATSVSEKNAPKIVDINGIQVGFVAYTETINAMKSVSNDAAMEYGINLISNCNAVSDVQACRDAGADVVIAYVSWGEMFSRETTSSQLKIAKTLVGAGVDVIIGYNPHVIQPVYWLELENEDGTVNRTLCLCSAGNFLSNSREQYTDSGVIFEFTIQEKTDGTGYEITNPKYVPTYVWATDNEDGTSEYRVVAAGEWLNDAPEGMNYAKHSRLKEVYAEAQNILGTDIASVSAS